jgi:hypothetical protein
MSLLEPFVEQQWDLTVLTIAQQWTWKNIKAAAM